METRELLNQLAENVSVRRSFGAAYERDGALIIPVALVAGGGGGGHGPIKSPSTTPAQAVDAAEPASGAAANGAPPTGTGGGFGGVVLPVGVYVVKGDQVRWVPAFDVTLIVLAGFGLVRALLRSLRHGRRRSRA